jgi:hypothetical protein
MSHVQATFSPTLLLFLALATFGCSSSDSGDPVASDGEGTVNVTTWGEEYVEEEIPADSGDGSGFVDGWTVTFDKFLVNFQKVEIADSDGTTAALMSGSKLFDNTASGVKSVVDFPRVPARAWDSVSYEIAPVDEDTELDESASNDDKTLMQDGGYSVYVSGAATKGDEVKTFAWGFATSTRYEDCHSEQGGRDEAGIVVKNNVSLDVQLTTHGDHFFYDRLQSSSDPSVTTSLRFDALAEADADEDGEVTWEELDAAPLDVLRYNPSGLEAATHGAFVRELVRTVGHFRGEGECTVRKL